MMTLRRCIMAAILLLWAWGSLAWAQDAAAMSGQRSRLWRLAEQEQAMIEQRGVVLHDAALTHYLQTVATRLWRQVHSDLRMPVIRVVKQTRMEAYAYPNGYCYLTTGMLDQLANEDQLAIVLAHEMVHYARQHSVALYHHLQDPMTEADTGLQYADHIPAAGGWLTKQKIEAAEYQADDEGLSILQRTGYRGAEVLPLLSSLRDSFRERGHPEMVAQLEIRMKNINTMLGHAAEGIAGATMPAVDQVGFQDHIAPAAMANGQAALQRGDWRQAERSLAKYLAIRADDAHAYYLKGEILRRQNHPDGVQRSIGFYEQTLKIDPNFAPAHRALGELYFKAGRHGMAKPHFEAFLDLRPQDATREYIKGYLQLCQD